MHLCTLFGSIEYIFVVGVYRKRVNVCIYQHSIEYIFAVGVRVSKNGKCMHLCTLRNIDLFIFSK